MRLKTLSTLLALATAGVLVSVPLLAQSQGSAESRVAAKPAPAAKGWTMPRTPDGKPDLQGVYSNAQTIPVARPAYLGAKEFYTDEADKEASANAAPARGGRGGAAPGANNTLAVHYDNGQFGLGGPSITRVASLRTSILSGPEGRVPALTPEAAKAAADRRAYQQVHQWDSAQTRPLAERCLTWGFEGPPMMPVGYNSTLQIVQGKGYVAIVQEMIHDTRVIPTDGSPHVPSAIRQWMGDSRGHWEGDTLVVETVNFEPRTPFQQVPFSDAAKVTERFTRVDANTVRYQFTVDDPKTWVKPFSGEYDMVHIDSPIYEYACHEGNYGMENNLSGARATEKQ
ncbi:MAG TPA: hypothetical protein VLM42_10305 [Bryobacteraceae bacterium]|nr:hypothetical protein [Bryobacteraceae bacterium]